MGLKDVRWAIKEALVQLEVKKINIPTLKSKFFILSQVIELSQSKSTFLVQKFMILCVYFPLFLANELQLCFISINLKCLQVNEHF